MNKRYLYLYLYLYLFKCQITPIQNNIFLLPRRRNNKKENEAPWNQ